MADVDFNTKLAIGLKVVIVGFLVGVLSQEVSLSSKLTQEMVIVALFFCVGSIGFWARYLSSSSDTRHLYSGGFFTMAAIVLVTFSAGVYFFEAEVNEENDATAAWLAIFAISLLGIVCSFISHSKTMVETKTRSSSKGPLFVVFQFLFGLGAPTIPLVILVSDAVESTAEVPYGAMIASTVTGYLSFVLFSIYFSQPDREDHIAVAHFAILFDIASAALSAIAAGYLFQSADETLVSSSGYVWALMVMPLLKLIQWIASHAYQAKVNVD